MVMMIYNMVQNKFIQNETCPFMIAMQSKKWCHMPGLEVHFIRIIYTEEKMQLFGGSDGMTSYSGIFEGIPG